MIQPTVRSSHAERLRAIVTQQDAKHTVTRATPPSNNHVEPETAAVKRFLTNLNRRSR